MRGLILKEFSLVWLIAFGSAAWMTSAAAAESYTQGPKVCKECHEAEFEIWEDTKHAKRYKNLHKIPKAKKMVAALGTGKSPKKSPVCTNCHYTMVQNKASSKGKAKAGVACESCHGPSSAYEKPHADVPKDETAEQAATRLEESRKLGLIHSSMHYDIALNCMECHGLARPDMDADVLAKLMAADHPWEPEFELVKYSQGSIRHRFYPPEMSVNQEMSDAELARFFVTGQAAKIVTASAAADKTTDAEYKKVQQLRVEEAKKVLASVKSVLQAGALIAAPNEANARKLVDAIQDKDLSGEVGSMLPSKKKYE
jgi:cytochrome c553